MTSASRTFVASISAVVIILAGVFFITSSASGSTPVAFNSGTATCTTDSLGYCAGPALPFAPNAVTLTVQKATGGASQAMAQLTTTSFHARFFRPSGGVAAAVTVTYSYLATRGTTAVPTTTVSTGTVIANAFTTGYGWPDNDPPGTAVSDPILHTGAGGVGTYANPITIAVGYVGTTKDYAAGTKFYIPNVRRYFIVEDTCAACHATPAGSSTWVDVWVGGNGSDDAGVLACENALTGNHTIIRNPDSQRVVVSGSLFNSTTKTCAAQFGG